MLVREEHRAKLDLARGQYQAKLETQAKSALNRFAEKLF